MNKNKLFLICLFTGIIGGHYFAIGKIKRGLLYFFTVGLFGFGWIYDLFQILLQENFKTYIERKESVTYNRYKKNQSFEFNYQCTELTEPHELPSNYVVLDFETTGLNPGTDRIIQVAAIRYRNFTKVEQFVTYVNPGITIPQKITKLTGIKNSDVKNAPYINQIMPKLTKFIGSDVIVAHNAVFDIKFLVTNMWMCKLNLPSYVYVDTLGLARKYMRDVENHKLVTLKEYLNIKATSHLADEDCLVCNEVYKYCIQIATKLNIWNFKLLNLCWFI